MFRSDTLPLGATDAQIDARCLAGCRECHEQDVRAQAKQALLDALDINPDEAESFVWAYDVRDDGLDFGPACRHHEVCDLED